MKWIRKNKVRSLRYIYFYHATVRSEDGLSITHLSGILTWLKPITSYDNLLEAKNLIAKDNNFNPSSVIIDSLSFLQKTYIQE